ncbi:MAG: hypothetical protein NTX05_06235 [Fusobacteria bacterium]|nr:hypothetical protein [Fusobacteriota bacterium]
MLRKILKKLYYKKQWILLFSKDVDIAEVVELEKFTKLIPPKDRFWADPFIIRESDKIYVFVEEYLYKLKKGYISVLELDSEFHLIKNTKIIENPYHMSYPFVFLVGGMYYMIPETAENNSVDLYRCNNFPYEWEIEKTLISEVKAVDTTICYANETYFLFTNIFSSTTKDPYAKDLFLYFSEDIFQPFKKISCSPIVSDNSSSRCAGKIFEMNNNLYRPSQNSSKVYGGSIKISKISLIDTLGYAEKKIMEIFPERGANATHTVNIDGNLIVVDQQIFRKRFG